MNIGILIFSAPAFAQYAGVERLTESGQKLGHTIVHLYEPYFNLSGNEIWYEGKPMPNVDVIIARPNFIEEPGLHAYVVRVLQKNGYRVINGLVSYGPVKNKLEQIQEFDRLGLPYPKSIITKQPQYAREAARLLGFPLIIKVAFGTVGSGIFYADSEETFQPIVDYLQIRDKNPVIVQKFIAEADRKDLRIFVVGNEIVAAMMRCAPDRDVRANATHGGVGSLVELTDAEKKLALDVAREVGLDVLLNPAGAEGVASIQPRLWESAAKPVVVCLCQGAARLQAVDERVRRRLAILQSPKK